MYVLCDCTDDALSTILYIGGVAVAHSNLTEMISFLHV